MNAKRNQPDQPNEPQPKLAGVRRDQASLPGMPARKTPIAGDSPTPDLIETPKGPTAAESVIADLEDGAAEDHPEYQYLRLLKDILENGTRKEDHNTSNGLRSVFGRQIRFDLAEGFPLLTTKKVYWHGVLHELVWFLTGQSNIKYLVDNNVHIWDDYPYKDYQKLVEKKKAPKLSKEEFIEKIATDASFAEKYGELPHIYGEQWRRWPRKNGGTIDQIAWVLDNIKHCPQRKHSVVTVWNPEHLYSMALPGMALSFPLCHIFFHFNVQGDRLSCQLYQRSADMFLGVPFNIASYAMLTQVMAHLAGLKPGEFVHTFGDAHVYENHEAQVREQLNRTPRAFPTLKISNRLRDVDEVRAEHFALKGYDPHPVIKGDLTVAGGFQEQDRRDFGKEKKTRKPARKRQTAKKA